MENEMRKGCFTLILGLTLLIAVGSALLNAGWGALFLCPTLYMISCLFYLLVHSRAIPEITKENKRILFWVVISHILFIIAYLLQWDAGDTPGSLAVLTLLGGRRGGEAQNLNGWPVPFLMNFLVFIPVIGSWIVITRLVERETKKESDEE